MSNLFRNFELNKNNDLKSSSGESLLEKEESMRNFLANDIKTKKKERDSTLGESVLLKNKIIGFFNPNSDKNPHYLKREATNLSIKIDMTLKNGKRNIQEEIGNEIEKILKETVANPLYGLMNLFGEERLKSLKNDKEKADAKKEVLNGLNIENLTTAFLDPILRDEIKYIVIRFLESPTQEKANIKDACAVIEPILKTIKEKLDKNELLVDGSDVLDVFNEIIPLLEAGPEIEDATNDIKKIEVLMKDQIMLNFIEDGFYKKYEEKNTDNYGHLIKEPKLLDFLINNTSDKLSSWVNDRIKKTFDTEDLTFMNSHCKSDSFHEREKAISLMDKYLNIQFNISVRDISDAWNIRPWSLSGNNSYRDIELSIEKMKELEKEIPGGVKFLLETYGIKEFQRYPLEMLKMQIKEESIQKPYGIVLFPRADHNGAFDNDEDVLENMFTGIKNKYGVKIMECNSGFDFARKVITLDKKFGEQNKPSFIIIGAHGNPYSFDLGSFPRVRSNPTISKTAIQKESLKSLGEYFIEKPQVVLFSCSTGREGGIAEAISREFNADVIAPKTSTSPKSVKTTIGGDGKIKFSVEYLGGEDVAQMYSSKEEVNP